MYIFLYQLISFNQSIYFYKITQKILNPDHKIDYAILHHKTSSVDCHLPLAALHYKQRKIMKFNVSHIIT